MPEPLTKQEMRLFHMYTEAETQLAVLRDEVDQQRIRAEAAEAERDTEAVSRQEWADRAYRAEAALDAMEGRYNRVAGQVLDLTERAERAEAGLRLMRTRAELAEAIAGPNDGEATDDH